MSCNILEAALKEQFNRTPLASYGGIVQSTLRPLEVHILYVHFNFKSAFALRIWELMICIVAVGHKFLSGIRRAITREKQEQSPLEARHSFINPSTLQWYLACDKHLAVRRTGELSRQPFL